MTRLEWIHFNYRVVPIVAGVIAMAAAAIVAFMFFGGSNTTNDPLIAFLTVVRLVVPVILIGIAAAWLASKVVHWSYNR